MPFLLVGNATEPKVIFDRAHVSFKTLLVGRSAHETVFLVNQEPILQSILYYILKIPLI